MRLPLSVLGQVERLESEVQHLGTGGEHPRSKAHQGDSDDDGEGGEMMMVMMIAGGDQPRSTAHQSLKRCLRTTRPSNQRRSEVQNQNL